MTRAQELAEAKLRRGTEFALGFPGATLDSAECHLLLDKLADAEALAEALEYVDGNRERLIMGGFSHIESRVSKALARYRGEKP